MTPAPQLNREQVRRFDRLAIERYGLTGLVLMENAGRACTDVLCELGISGPVVICCGKGNNGGDGLVIARHLDLRGYETVVCLSCDPRQLMGDASTNYEIAERAKLQRVVCDGLPDAAIEAALTNADWIVDALLGTGASGNPRKPVDSWIAALNRHSARKLAIDLPSGLDCDSGAVGEPTFRADHTCTMVAVKPGLVQPDAQPYVGQLHVCDIGAPRRVWQDL